MIPPANQYEYRHEVRCMHTVRTGSRVDIALCHRFDAAPWWVSLSYAFSASPILSKHDVIRGTGST